MADINKIIDYIEENLSEKRKIHTYGVRNTAVYLAEKYGENVDNTIKAALYHDLFRGKDIDVINSYVNKYKLDKKYLNNANLAHSKVAAEMIKREFEETNEDIINAVSFHTTGRYGMSKLEKIIFIADAIEPGRDYPVVNRLRELVLKDLDEACLLSIKKTIEFVRSENKFLDPDTIEAQKYFEELTAEKENENDR